MRNLIIPTNVAKYLQYTLVFTQQILRACFDEISHNDEDRYNTRHNTNKTNGWVQGVPAFWDLSSPQIV